MAVPTGISSPASSRVSGSPPPAPPPMGQPTDRHWDGQARVQAPQAMQRGMAVLAWSPLAGGRLADPTDERARAVVPFDAGRALTPPLALFSEFSFPSSLHETHP